jgi:tetratricopeptide (TPR) repeat protein
VELEKGDAVAALATAQEAVEVGEFATSDMERGLAHLTLGYAASATGALGRAQEAFAEAEQLFDGLDATVLSREARAGRAGALAAAGRPGEAAQLLEDVLEHLDLAGLEGSLRLGAVLLTCCEVLAAAGHPRADEVLAQARATLQEAAGRIGDEAMASRFLGTPLVARILAGSAAAGSGADASAQGPVTAPPPD